MLRSKRIIKAEEVAERFEISKRTVYRDIRALEEAGVPIGAEAGIGYYLTEGYHLPPVMFTRNEASAMITAEKLVEKFTDHSLNRQFKSALDKIKSVLPVTEKDFLESLTDKIEILHDFNFNTSDFPNNYLTEIQNALASKRVLKIDYFAYYANKLTEDRSVEPIGLCYYGFAWHLIGRCRLRNDYRDFRLDRIKNLTISDERFTTSDKLLLNEYLKGIYQSHNLEPIVVRFCKSVITYVEKPKYYYGFTDEKEIVDKIEMYFLMDSLPYIARWIVSYGNKAEIISPESLKKEMVEIVTELKEHYLQ